MTTASPATSKPWPVLALGFRPFYLAGAASAVILLTLWLATLGGHLTLPVPDALGWHAHEMLFGFAAAIIAGFLFTAVRNWTGGETPRGAGLGALVLLWLAGRIAPFIATPMIAAVIDLAFLPAIAIAVARPIAAMTPPRGKRRPWLPVVMLTLLGIANLLHHTGYAGLGRALGFGTVAMLIAVIAGRVIPSFTMTGAQVSVPAAP
ncbi:NnrS family protein, partial [Ferrovibrio sp.]|uniref:NnrS family protein n=1 Tax=Ferrovibrio sp. TaxID=1917215 RepID=UPI0025B8434F